MNENNRLEFFFNTFERVLVRSKDVKFAIWNPNIYLYTSEGMHRLLRGPDTHKAHCEIIPYEGNEHLVGTIGIPIKPWEPKEGELVAVASDKRFWYPKFFLRKESDGSFSVKSCPEHSNSDRYLYCEPLRKHFDIPDEE